MKDGTLVILERMSSKESDLNKSPILDKSLISKINHLGYKEQDIGLNSLQLILSQTLGNIH